jgi:UDP-N-acetylglucosamine 2-epimerase (non-hydrolysing)
MIDTLIRMLPAAHKRIPTDLPEHYALVTLHRPANVDDPQWLGSMLQALNEIGGKLSVLFPIHPRTRQRLADAGLSVNGSSRIKLMDPLPYLDFLALQTQATVVITDSGGIQEETTYLGKPCLTVRENTERPITEHVGTNVLVGRDTKRVKQEVERILAGTVKKNAIPELWDGKASERIADIFERLA